MYINNINIISKCVIRGSIYKPDKYETRNCYPTQSKEILGAMEKKLNELIQCEYI